MNCNYSVMYRLACDIVNDELHKVGAGDIISMNRVFLDRELAVTKTPDITLAIKAVICKLNCQRSASGGIRSEISYWGWRHMDFNMNGIYSKAAKPVHDSLICYYMSAQSRCCRIKHITCDGSTRENASGRCCIQCYSRTIEINSSDITDIHNRDGNNRNIFGIAISAIGVYYTVTDNMSPGAGNCRMESGEQIKSLRKTSCELGLWSITPSAWKSSTISEYDPAIV